MKNFRFLFSLILLLFVIYLLVNVNSNIIKNPYVTKVQINVFAVSILFLVLFPDFFSFIFVIAGLVLLFFCDNMVCSIYSISISALGIMSFIFAYRFFYLSTGYHYYCPNCDQYLGAHMMQCPLCGSHNVKKVVYNVFLYFIYKLKRKIYYVSY